MKKIFCFVLILTMLCPLTLVGCLDILNSQTLAIDDVTARVGEEAVQIVAHFGDESKKEYIEYTYDETKLSIKDDKVTALQEGTYTVTANTFSCKNVTFTVTCLGPEEYISVSDTYAWFNLDPESPIVYPASEVTVKLHESLKDEAVVLTCDSDSISIDGNMITALKEDVVEVTATVAGKSTTFLVYSKGVNLKKSIFSTEEWKRSGMEDSTAQRWQNYGTENSTIFIGDSFFDPYFFSTFNSFYNGYDALCMGIGGTRSYQWELYFETILKDAQPKNVVVNLGNNNVYNDGLMDDAEATIESLQRFHTLLHGRMPNAKIYTFSITARNYNAAWKPQEVILEINEAMKEWCEGKDWIEFIDLQDVMTYDKLIDNIHPIPSNYTYFVQALYEAGIEIEVK